MNQLVSSPVTFGAEVQPFCTLIKTGITIADGRTAAALTFLTELGMWKAVNNGLNQALKSDGRAESWQSSVFSLTSGSPCLFTQFARVNSGDMLSYTEEIHLLSNVIKNLRTELATVRNKAATADYFRNYSNKILKDLIAAHKKIGALEYTLESHGITVPNIEG